jgi:DnaJ-domain-containing protein 1
VDWGLRLIQRMLLRMQRGMARGMQEGMAEILQELGKGGLDWSKLAGMMKQMGMDPSQLSGMVGKMPGFDCYQVLGLDKSASDEEIKKRYNELLKKLHPDTAGVPGTEFLLQMVIAAYEMIKRERGWV